MRNKKSSAAQLRFLVLSAATAAAANPPPPPPPAPSTFMVTFSTDIHPGAAGQSWAPLGADRFYAVVNAGFYDNSAFFRVVAPNTTGCSLTCGGIVQFGISGSKAMNQQWLHAPIKDDPVTQPNVAGQGKAGFAPFGKISSKAGQYYVVQFSLQGCSVDSGSSRLSDLGARCDPNKNCSYGVNQGSYEALGNPWIKASYPGINFITKAAVT
eukprot:gene17142-2464_t